jgi:NitT/TauT family transport system substrate-binding protein
MIGYLEAVRLYNDALIEGLFKGPAAKEVVDILIDATMIKDRAVYDKVFANGCDPNGMVNEGSLQKDLDFFKTARNFSWPRMLRLRPLSIPPLRDMQYR